MMNINPKLLCQKYFTEELAPLHKKYLALRDFFVEGLNAAQVADKHGYTISTVYSMTRDFRQELNGQEDPFFKAVKIGRKPIDHKGEIAVLVVSLRKKYLSVPDIQVALDARGISLTIYTIEKILTDEGFARLPRRDKKERLDSNASAMEKLPAPVAKTLKANP
jgi:transposase